MNQYVRFHLHIRKSWKEEKSEDKRILYLHKNTLEFLYKNYYATAPSNSTYSGCSNSVFDSISIVQVMDEGP